MAKIKRIVTSNIEGRTLDDKFEPNTYVVGSDGRIDYHSEYEYKPVIEPGIVYGANKDSGDNYGFNTIKLVPHAPDADITDDRYIIVDPTFPNHIHLRAGGRQGDSQAELILGGEKVNVRVSDDGGYVGISSGLKNLYYSLQHDAEEASNSLITFSETRPPVGSTVIVGESSWTVDSVTEDEIVSGKWIISTDNTEDLLFQPGVTYEFVEEQGPQYYWYFGNDGMFSGPGMGTVYVPAISSLGEGADLYLSSPDGSVIITGDTGEFIGSDEVPSNQIATLADIGVETEYAVEGGTAGTQPTFSGDPLFTASYVLMSSNLVHFEIQVDMDNILTFGTGQYIVTLPFPAKAPYIFRDGCVHDNLTGKQYHISGHVAAGSNEVFLFTSTKDGNRVEDEPFSSTEPFTLTTSDNFHIAGTYIRETPA